MLKAFSFSFFTYQIKWKIFPCDVTEKLRGKLKIAKIFLLFFDEKRFNELSNLNSTTKIFFSLFFLSFLFYVAVFNLLCFASLLSFSTDLLLTTTNRVLIIKWNCAVEFFERTVGLLFMFPFCASHSRSLSLNFDVVWLLTHSQLLFCYYCGSSVRWKRVSECERIDGVIFIAKKRQKEIFCLCREWI